jgi:hypothetical protein
MLAFVPRERLVGAEEFPYEEYVGDFVGDLPQLGGAHRDALQNSTVPQVNLEYDINVVRPLGEVPDSLVARRQPLETADGRGLGPLQLLDGCQKTLDLDPKIIDCGHWPLPFGQQTLPK